MSDDYTGGEREQSTIGFPYSDLDEAMRVARHMLDARVPVDRDQLAGLMNQVPRSGAFGAKVASARMFGLIDNVTGKYQLTELGYEILDPSRAASAAVTAFLHVPLYKKVYEDFRGRQLPPKGPGLERLFVSMGVAPKQKERARRVFEASARQANFFNLAEDRLVLPVTANLPAVVDESDDDGDELFLLPRKDEPQAPTHHPFIEGLLATLPEEDSDWPVERRVKWLEAASKIFDLIYKDEKTGTVVIEIKSAPRKANE